MPPFLMKIIAWLILALVVIILVGGGGWYVMSTISSLKADNATLTANHTVDLKAIDDSKKAIADLQAKNAADMASVVADYQAALAASANTTKIIKEVHNVPGPVRTVKDCPGDPAYDVLFDRLWVAGPGGRTGPGGGASDGTGGPAGSGGPPR